MNGTQKRSVMWEDHQVETLVTAAKVAGRPSIVLAALLASELGQREADMLKLTWERYKDGRFVFTQGKGDLEVSIPCTRLLRATLEAAPRLGETIVVSEITARAYLESNFQHLFAKMRTSAKLPKEMWYMDLRRSAVVRMARAGCTVAQIASVTGHTLRSVTTILEYYLPRDGKVADGAIAAIEKARRKNQK